MARLAKNVILSSLGEALAILLEKLDKNGIALSDCEKKNYKTCHRTG